MQWVKFTESVVVEDHTKGTEREVKFDKGDRVELDPASAEHWRARAKCVFVGEPGSEGNGAGGAAEQSDAAKIVAAIGNLGLNNPDHFTKDGVPNAKALGTIVGFSVTAVQRDAAWAKYQTRGVADVL